MTIRVIIGFCLLAGLAACRHGKHQQIQLKNASSETIYFMISPDSILPNANYIAGIRPITYESDLSKIDAHLSSIKGDEDLAAVKYNLYRHRISKGDTAIVMSSESAGIFGGVISIQRIINDQYNGKINIFVVSENDLSKYSDETIIEKKLYKHVTSLTGKNITDDTITIQYF